MSFYEYSLQPQWSECDSNPQYITMPQNSFMNYEKPDVAIVPTSLLDEQYFEFYYNDQYNMCNEVNLSHQTSENMPYLNQPYNQCYSSLLHVNQCINYETPVSNQISHKSSPININSKRISKAKRHRTVFKLEQVEALENYYKHTQFVTAKERQQLQEALQISDKTIKVWFQNRRLKDRRESKQSQQMKIEETTQSYHYEPNNVDHDIRSEIDKLTEEFQIKQEKDELDDFLLSVISPTKQDDIPPPTNKQNIFYEPISPADSSVEEREIASVQKFEAKELLKTFLNFQN